jgi:ribose-phosphate pyrophosphokinase
MPLIFNLGCDAKLYASVVSQLNAQSGNLELRHFPDGESYVRVLTDCVDQQTIILCGLDQPNAKTLPLLLVADTLRDLGATCVGLITPYLAYMRQDIRFKDGEGITSRYFAALLSNHLDWLVTVDPHLHRYDHLSEIYSIDTMVAPSAPVLADWIGQRIENPLLIGPDSESEQWVTEVASLAGAPYLILEKTRSGDRNVQVSVPSVEKYAGRVPVLIDDIVSTGHTFIETIKHLKALGMPPPVCMAVHGVFAEGALDGLYGAGASDVVTCNTIHHESNAMDVSVILAEAARTLLDD